MGTRSLTDGYFCAESIGLLKGIPVSDTMKTPQTAAVG
jgi:hypothetical protein